ncbi:LysR family transcriptional regulator [Nocardia abscessus]|uniref:LysR family transcriptional regulator n=1 Tax=Nocardia abscessus TaxID=120957 RepID=UPI0024543B82|nr:LysR family transcriptional regulator [Nocardia abscessus]
MDIESLRWVVTLADELHFGRASQLHYVSAGHFGRQIQRLERELGVRLFDRTSRRVALTPAGARVVAHARNVLDTLEELRNSADPAPSSESGILRIGTLGFGMAERWVLLRDTVLAAMPELTLVHEELDVLTQYDAVRRGEVDVGIVHYGGEFDGLVAQPVFTTPYAAVVPMWSPLADADILSWDDVPGKAWIPMSGARPRTEETADLSQKMSRRSSVLRHPAAIPAAVATTGLIGLHGLAASRYLARPDVRFVPFDTKAVVAAVITRESDDRPAVRTFRDAVVALDRDVAGT